MLPLFLFSRAQHGLCCSEEAGMWTEFGLLIDVAVLCTLALICANGL